MTYSVQLIEIVLLDSALLTQAFVVNIITYLRRNDMELVRVKEKKSKVFLRG